MRSESEQARITTASRGVTCLTNRGYVPMIAYAFDPRGNGGGHVTPTITGDHENRITDYTALAVMKGDEAMNNEEYVVRRLTPLE